MEIEFIYETETNDEFPFLDINQSKFKYLLTIH